MNSVDSQCLEYLGYITLTTGPRSSSSTTGLSSLNESLESITSSISEESSTGFLETQNGMLIFFFCLIQSWKNMELPRYSQLFLKSSTWAYFLLQI